MNRQHASSTSRPGLPACTGGLLLAFAHLALGSQGPISPPPARDGGPLPVYVAMGLLDVDEVNGADQSFTANLFVQVRWHDPRLAHDGPGNVVLPLHEVWHPELLFVNQQKVWPTFPKMVHVEPDGTVEYRQRVWGPFSQPLEVRDFPFDKQEFEMRVACGSARSGEIVFEADPESPSGLADNFSLPDWHILEWYLNFDPYRPTGARRGVPSFALVFRAQRYASHYVAKIILPLVLIVAMSWIVFLVDPKESGTQIGVATTSMLTLIAYRFMVGGQIPAVPYLTKMDVFILGSTLLVFGALAQAVVTSIMANRDRYDKARTLDVWCRVIFPLAFVGIILWTLMH